MTEEEKALQKAVEIFARTEQAKAYYKACDAYNPEMSYEEYIVHVFRCLMLSDWHYSADSATSRIRDNIKFIRESYEKKESVIDAMVEAGYCCG